MNKIHPLLIVALLAIVAVFVHVKRVSFQEALLSENSKIGQLDVSLKEIVNAKTKWQDSKNKLETIIKNKRYKGVEFKQEERAKVLILTALKLNADQFRTLTNKLLNSYIVIKKISFKKDKEELSLIVEVEK